MTNLTRFNAAVEAFRKAVEADDAAMAQATQAKAQYDLFGGGPLAYAMQNSLPPGPGKDLFMSIVNGYKTAAEQSAQAAFGTGSTLLAAQAEVNAAMVEAVRPVTTPGERI